MKMNYTFYFFTVLSLLGYNLETTAQAPSNDLCSTLTLVASDGTYCSSIGEFTNINATSDEATYGLPSCWTQADEDVWFQFTTNGILDFKITVLGNPDGSVTNPIDAPQIALYRGDCVGGFAEVACSTSSMGMDEVELIIENLDNLENYYIRVNDDSQAGDFQLCVELYDPFPIPSNDDCANAISVSATVPYCSGAEEFTNISATSSPPVPDYGTPSCWTSNQRDVWFTFTVDGTTDLQITIDGNASGNSMSPLMAPQVVIYDGDCTNNFTELFCAQAASNESIITLDAIGLTDMQTYYIRVSDYNTTNNPLGGNFQICIEELPAEFNMSNGLTNLCNGTLYDPSGPDNDYFDEEYYVFQICPTEPHTCVQLNFIEYEIAGGGPGPGGGDFLNIYAGQIVDGNALVNTIQGIGANEMIEIVDSCVTLEFSSDFFQTAAGFEMNWSCTNNCVTVFPTTNDACTDAISISGAGDYCSNNPEFSTLNATSSNTANGYGIPSCWNNDDNDTWFTFTADLEDYVLDINGTNVLNPEIAIYSGDCTNGFTEIACENGQGLNLNTNIFGLTIGETYYIRVNDQNGGTFQLCLNEYQPIISNTTVTECSGTIFDTGGPNGDYSLDEQFQFTICPDDPFSCIILEFVNYDIGDNAFLAFSDDVFVDQENAIEFFNGEAGSNEVFELYSDCITVAFFSFDGYGGGGTAPGFEVSWTCTNDCDGLQPATNDACVDAITIDASGDYCSGETEFSTIGATSSAANYPAPSCWSSSDRDVWFTFTAGNDSDMTASIFGANISNLQMALYQGNCTDGFTELDCIEDLSGNAEIVMDIFGLTQGETYYIRVSDADDAPDGGAFELCLTTYFPSIMNGTTTECSGTIFDTGGELDTYSEDEYFVYTICPTEKHNCINIDLPYYAIEEDWDFLNIYEGDQPIPNSQIASLTGFGQNETFEVLTTGCVTLEFISDYVVVDEGFELSWSCSSVCSTSNQEIQNQNEFEIYPNPTSDYLYIDLKDISTNNLSYSISTIDGKVIFSEEINESNFSLDVKDLSSGVYIIQIKNQDNIWIKKWSKN